MYTPRERIYPGVDGRRANGFGCGTLLLGRVAAQELAGNRRCGCASETKTEALINTLPFLSVLPGESTNTEAARDDGYPVSNSTMPEELPKPHFPPFLSQFLFVVRRLCFLSFCFSFLRLFL